MRELLRAFLNLFRRDDTRVFRPDPDEVNRTMAEHVAKMKAEGWTPRRPEERPRAWTMDKLGEDFAENVIKEQEMTDE